MKPEFPEAGLKSIPVLFLSICILFFQIPILTMLADQPRALELGAWDWRSFAIFASVIFIVVPVVLMAVSWFLTKTIGTTPTYVIAVTTVGYFLAAQIDYYYLREVSAPQAFAIDAFIAMASIAVLVLAVRYVFIAANAIALISPALFLYMLLTAAPLGAKAPQSETDQTTIGQFPHHIFIMSFEKLVWSYLSDPSGGNVDHAYYPNLAEFVDSSELFTNAHSTSSATWIALKSLYSGQVFRPTDVTSKQNVHKNIISLFENSHDVLFFNDINQDLCDPDKHRCIATLGGINDSRRANLLMGFLRTWFQTYSVWQVLGTEEEGWHFDPWEDMWFDEVSDISPDKIADRKKEIFERIGNRQIDYVFEVLDGSSPGPKLTVLHNFVSDAPLVKNSRLEVSQSDFRRQIDKQKQQLANFDELWGRFVSGLQEREIFNDSLIVLTADTAYTPDWARYAMSSAVPKEMIDTPEFSTVLLAIKWPGQRSKRTVTETVSHIDVLPMILEKMGVQTNFPMDGSASHSAPPRFVHYVVNGGYIEYMLDDDTWVLVEESSEEE